MYIYFVSSYIILSIYLFVYFIYLFIYITFRYPCYINGTVLYVFILIFSGLVFHLIVACSVINSSKKSENTCFSSCLVNRKVNKKQQLKLG